MKFVMGETPKWKSKPKVSPLDFDPDFQKFIAEITSGAIKVGKEAGIYVHDEADGKRLGVKNPARMVRDTLNRILKERNLRDHYRVACRLTDEDGLWGVWATRLEPREPVSKRASRKSA